MIRELESSNAVGVNTYVNRIRIIQSTQHIALAWEQLCICANTDILVAKKTFSFLTQQTVHLFEYNFACCPLFFFDGYTQQYFLEIEQQIKSTFHWVQKWLSRDVKIAQNQAVITETLWKSAGMYTKLSLIVYH